MASSNSSTSNMKQEDTMQRKQKMSQQEIPKPACDVTFLVGLGFEKVSIDRKVACAGSPVLQAEFKRLMEENEPLIYNLELFQIRTFRFLEEWLYCGDIVLKPWRNERWSSAAFAVESCELLFELWILADKLKVPALQNETMKLIHEIYDDDMILPSPSMTWYDNVYDKTEAGSPLRRILVRYASIMDAYEIENTADFLPRQMLKEIVLLLCFEGGDLKEKAVEVSDFLVSED